MKKEFKIFEDAKQFVLLLNLKTVNEWNKYAKSGNKPDDIPSNPQNTYKKDWISWGDWLGTGTIATINFNYRSFEEARKFTKLLGLKRQKDWIEYCQSGKKPKDIPRNPYRTYKNEWKGIGDWLGTGRVATYNMTYRSFQDARTFSRQLGLNDNKNWTKYCNSGNKPDDIPSAPWQVYKKWNKK